MNRIKATDMQVLECFDRTSSAKTAAHELGISAQTVRSVLRRNGRNTRVWKPSCHVADDVILEAYRQTNNLNVVARELHVGYANARRVLAAHGVSLTGLQTYRDRMRAFTSDDLDQIAALYREGSSASAIAKRYGRSVATVLQALRGRKVTVKSHRRITDDLLSEMKGLYDSGISLRRIGTMIGMSERRVTCALRKYAPGIIRPRVRAGLDSPMWKGGRLTSHHSGYVWVLADRGDPLAMSMRTKGGYVLEHRLVLARSLGRPLAGHETVHHINGNKADNRLENLQLRAGKHGKGGALVCHSCGSRNVGPAPLTTH